jgi:nitrate reductase NapE
MTAALIRPFLTGFELDQGRRRSVASSSLRTEWIFVMEPAMGQPDHAVIKRRERIAFLLLTAVVFPLVTVMIVAGYGFLVWIWQMFAGPPTGH